MAVPGATAEGAELLSPAAPGPTTRRRGGHLRFAEGLEVRPPPLPLCIAMVFAYAGVAVLRPALPQNTAYVDPLILVLCFYSVCSMVYRGSPATTGAARLLPWFWLILLGSFLGLAAVGIPYWAMSNLARTVFALMTFVCLWHLVGVARVQRFAIIGTAIGLFVTCVALVVQKARYRDSAYFQHPNYAGHFCVMAAVVLVSVSKHWWSKVAAVLGLAIAIGQTSSFGAIAMLVAMLAVWGFRVLTRNTAVLAAALAMLAIGGLLLTSPQAADLIPSDTTGDGWAISETISEARFERSQASRIALWSQALDAYAKEPLGIGPDGVRRRNIAQWRGTQLEIHSDGLGYLVERGVIGLIGFVGLWVTLIVLAKKRGLARVLIAGMIVQGLFRETMHYRHMWLLLALAFAVDYARSPPSTNEDDTATASAEGALAPAGAPVTEDPDPLRLADPYFPAAGGWPRGDA